MIFTVKSIQTKEFKLAELERLPLCNNFLVKSELVFDLTQKRASSQRYKISKNDHRGKKVVSSAELNHGFVKQLYMIETGMFLYVNCWNLNVFFHIQT